MNWIALTVAVLSAGPAQAQPAVATTNVVTINTTVWSAGGRPSGAGTPFLLKEGEAVVAFVGAGSSLCLPASARLEPSDTIAIGWRVELRLRDVSNERDLVIDALWQRLGSTPGQSPVPRRQLRLPESGRVQLDFLPAEAADAAAGCAPIGMGLELSRPPKPPTGLFELDVWLMTTTGSDNTEAQHQTVRTRLGDTTAFYFDAVALGRDRTQAQVEGTLHLMDLLNGDFSSDLTIARKNYADGSLLPSGSSTYPFKAALNEVVEFRVPMGGFSLRVRLRQLR